jgi:hypothetical protein
MNVFFNTQVIQLYEITQKKDEEIMDLKNEIIDQEDYYNR